MQRTPDRITPFPHPGMVFAIAFSAFLALPAAAVAAQPEDSAPVRLIVGFHEMPDQARPFESGHGRIVAEDDTLRFLVLETSAPGLLRDDARRDERVRFVEEDPVVTELLVPNDALWTNAYTYGPRLMGAPAAWDTTLGSTSVIAAVVDSGVRSTHKDLAAHYGGGIDLYRGDAIPDAETGHGTHVTGILAATTNNGVGVSGLAQVSFLQAKVTGTSGGTGSGMSSGIRWATDNGAHVISISLGTSTASTTLTDAVNYAWGKGAVIVAAAGNSGPGADTLMYPAKFPNVIAVGAVNSQKQLASFSSTGPDLDLVAPGYSIMSTWYTGDASYALLSGTSMAAPHVAGAAALLKSARPDLSNAQVKGLLESNAEDLGAAGLDNSFGRGLVRLDLAIAAAVAMPTADPAPAPEPEPTYGVDVSPASQSGSVRSGRGATTYTLTITNTGNAADRIGLALGTAPAGWSGTLGATSLDLAPGASADVTLTIKAAKGTRGETWAAVFTATSTGDGTASDAGTATTTAA